MFERPAPAPIGGELLAEQRRPVAVERPRLARHRVDGLVRGAVENSQRHRRRAAQALSSGGGSALSLAFNAVGGRERGGVLVISWEALFRGVTTAV